VINLGFCGVHASVDKVDASAPIVCPTHSFRREGVDIETAARHQSPDAPPLDRMGGGKHDLDKASLRATHQSSLTCGALA